MATIWYLGLGGLFAVYFALAGYDYGVGMLLTRAGGDAGRRAALGALGPFFLGNEVWLVAAAGVLLGAFPRLEGELFGGRYPVVAVALAGVIAVTAAVQLRSRPDGARARSAWDVVITVASALAAGGWGAVLGGLLQDPPPRVPDLAARFARMARRLIVLALAAVDVATRRGRGLLPRTRRGGSSPYRPYFFFWYSSPRWSWPTARPAGAGRGSPSPGPRWRLPCPCWSSPWPPTRTAD